jgi:tetratricopeptide (TPR) repeat protein
LGDGGAGVPEDVLSVIVECERLFAAGEVDAAKQRLLSLQSVTPVSEGEWKGLHSICLKLKDRTRAQLYTERFLGVCKDNASAHLANARNFGSVNNDRDRILESVDAALRNPPSDAGFWREIATIQKDVREYEAACDSARKSIFLDPTDAETRELLISSLGILWRTSEIRSECSLLARCLTESNEKNPGRWASLARIAAEYGATKQAKAYIDIAAGYISNVSYGAEVDLIRALILTRQPKRAMKHLEHMLAADSKNSWLWDTLLATAMSRGYYDIALIAIARLKAIPYQDPEFLYRLSLKEKSARSGGFLKGVVLNWVRSRAWWGG